ncbi:MAG TPA: hypothetical protein IAC86_02040 [Candidatus Cryptobacteroides excrementigallinarum]|nr:hypothetical protein [Candidatus Cryptobacteroides excrementigallinarum]
MRRLAAFLAIAVLLCGCNDSRKRNAFVENNDIRLQIGSTIQFRYDPLTCQLAFSRDRREFRAQTDNTSDYYSIVLSEIPANIGQRVSGNLTWTTETDILTRDDLDLEVLRIEGDQVWLWSSSGRTGVMIKLLE